MSLLPTLTFAIIFLSSWSLSSATPFNLTKILLEDAHHDLHISAYRFNDSGIDTEFDTSSGMTVFVPYDSAFLHPFQVPTQLSLLSNQSLSLLMKYHVIRGYYPLTAFPSSVSKPTLATEVTGPGKFLLKISKTNRSVMVSTGIVKAKVTRIIFDKSPIGIYAVSEVLLPREFLPYNNAPPVLISNVAAAAVYGSDLSVVLVFCSMYLVCIW